MTTSTRKIITLYIIVIFVKGSVACEEEQRLINTLLANYNTLVRPVERHTQVLNVELGIAIIQIVEVDQRKEKIILSMYLKTKWTDYRLRWNRSDYDNIDSIRLPPSKLWMPDIVLYNRIQEHAQVNNDEALISVSNNGECNQYPLAIVTAQCSIDVRWFPFDDQFCTLEFESWSYDLRKLNVSLQLEGYELTELKPNCEWNILDLRVDRMERLYECCPAPFSRIVYTMHLSRKVLYYAVNLILPCALISFLTPLSFLIPTEAGDRIGLGTTILLSMSVYQIIILEKIPTSSDGIPVIGLYFIVLICMNAVAMVVMIAIVNIKQRKDIPMPGWVHFLVFNCLAPLSRMSKITSSDSSGDQLLFNNPRQRSLENAETASLNGIIDICNPNDVTDMRSSNTVIDLDISHDVTYVCTTDEDERTNCVTNHSKTGQPMSDSSSRTGILRSTNPKTKTEDISEHRIKTNDWQYAAKIIERSCFWIFGTFHLITSFTLTIFILRNSLVTVTKENM